MYDEILAVIANPKKRRKDVAAIYPRLLGAPFGTDWMDVDCAILNRWSTAGLSYIRNQAFKRDQIELDL